MSDLPGEMTKQSRVAPPNRDEYMGTLVNSYLAQGGSACGIKAGHAYVDVGTVHGYRAAIALLNNPDNQHDAQWQRIAGHAPHERTRTPGVFSVEARTP